MPSAQIGSFGHLKLKGVCVLSLQRPSHIASVLEVLISSPDIDLNSSSSLKSCSICLKRSQYDKKLCDTNTMVSVQN